MCVKDQSAIPVGGAYQTVKRPRPELSIDDFIAHYGTSYANARNWLFPGGLYSR